MVLLENDQFLSRLTLMFDRSRTKGEVQITMKRYDGRTKPPPRAASPVQSGKTGKSGKAVPAAAPVKPRSDSSSSDHHEFSCLVRATCKNEKISSVIHSRDVNKFQQAYCNLLRSNMDGLKRQKKQKLKKAAE